MRPGRLRRRVRAAAFAPALGLGFLAAPLAAQEADATFPRFAFASGDTLPELRIHYRTAGTPRRDAAGVVRNAVLILHGTGGSHRQFFSPQFAGQLFGAGQLLDTTRYYVIVPDNIGHGGSSKPSDGLRARFPRYGYADMVRAQYLLVSEHLKVNHLRLILGTSMGCMHAWVWGTTYPDVMDGLVPLACAPTAITGRNRMMRRMIIDDIIQDPAWHGGAYTTQPPGVRAALQILFMMGSAPLVQQDQAPTRDKADSVIRAWLDQRQAATDANDMIYQFAASEDYDPSTRLARITAPVLFINSADDEVNPPELNVAGPLCARVPRCRFVLLPISPATRGHGTHTLPAVWGDYLREFLATLPER
ncbi:MAG: alpha/beta fold hydrolase [Gemmatimonadota bacterium]